MSRLPTNRPTHAAQARQQTQQPGSVLPPARCRLLRGLTLLAMAALATILLLRPALGQGWFSGKAADTVWIDLLGAVVLIGCIAWMGRSIRAQRRRDIGSHGDSAATVSAAQRVEPGTSAGTRLGAHRPTTAGQPEGGMSPAMAFDTPADAEPAQAAQGVAAANTLPADLDGPITRALPRPTPMASMARVSKAAPAAIDLRTHGTRPGAASAANTAGSGAHAAPARAAPVGLAGAISTWTPGRRSIAQAKPSWDAAIRRVVIVGNGIAGLTAAETVRAHHPQCEIHLIGRERQASYRRTGVTGLISQRSQLPDLALRPAIWYAEQRIHCWLNTRASTLDVDRQTLTLASMQELHYDRLILAMGANAWVPPTLEGFGVPGSFVLRSAADALALRAFVQRYGARRAVVLGAGLLGIETADALHQMSLGVHLLAQGEQVLEHQLDRDGAALVAAQLRHIGIKVLVHAGIRSLHRSGSDRLSRLRLDNGQVIEAELLVVCTGARPDTGLAEVAGIAVDRGVLVDEQMCSSAPGVYACGDVAQTARPQPGLWAPAAEQGRIAALAALGMAARYEQQVPIVTLALSGMQVRSAGQLHAEGLGQIELCHRPPTAAERATRPGTVRQGPGHASTTDFAAGSAADEATSMPMPSRALANFHTAERYTKVVVEIDRKGHEHVIGAIVVGNDPDADDILAAACSSAPSSSLGAALMQRPWQRQRGELIEPRPHSLSPSRPLPRDEPARVEAEPARPARRVA